MVKSTESHTFTTAKWHSEIVLKMFEGLENKISKLKKEEDEKNSKIQKQADERFEQMQREFLDKLAVKDNVYDHLLETALRLKDQINVLEMENQVLRLEVKTEKQGKEKMRQYLKVEKQEKENLKNSIDQAIRKLTGSTQNLQSNDVSQLGKPTMHSTPKRKNATVSRIPVGPYRRKQLAHGGL